MHTNTKKVFYLGSTSVLQNYTMSVNSLGYGVIGKIHDTYKNYDFFFHISNEVLHVDIPQGTAKLKFAKVSSLSYTNSQFLLTAKSQTFLKSADLLH